jgi:predicted NAD/FAD-binding protein
METNEERLKIAVVGAGIAGISAAHILSARHDVTLIERNDYVGGHTNTIDVREGSATIPVDTGFIVCNPKTYPFLYRLFDTWGVQLRDSDMSFGFSCDDSGLGYVGPSFREFLRKPSNLFNRRLLNMVREQGRFNRRARADLRSGAIDECMLDEYLDRVGASPFLIEHYLIPLAAAVWSSPDTDMLRFPAGTFFRFLDNHGLLNLRDRPTWQTVVGGSQAYVRAFLAQFPGAVMTNAPVASVRREPDGVSIVLENRQRLSFDRVVMALHADETLARLEDASDAEREALSAWSYHRNPVQLHTDISVLPKDKRLWASWNYRRRAGADPNAPVPITYDMNRLQGLRTTRRHLVSLNARDVVDPEQVIYEITYTHPGYTPRSLDAQQQLRALNGDRRTYYCGAYLRHGFHEDAVASAVEVAKHFGLTV